MNAQTILDTLPVLYGAVFFLFGACVGSFLNVVIYRLPHGLSLLHPPSTCPRCGTGIKAYDNIPILSWILLRGRCRACAAAISPRYPLIELANAIAWAAVGALHASATNSMWVTAGLITTEALFLSLLIVMTMIDIDWQIIPDELSLGGLGAAILASGLLPALHAEAVANNPAVDPWLSSLLAALLGAGAGAGLVLIISLVGTIAFRAQLKKLQETDPDIQTAIGFGDVKLMAFVGAWLGWESVVTAFFLGTILGAVIGVVLKFSSGRWPDAPSSPLDALHARWNSGESVMPFGPFLCGGALIMAFWGEPILEWLRTFFAPLRLLCGGH